LTSPIRGGIIAAIMGKLDRSRPVAGTGRVEHDDRLLTGKS